MSNKIRQEVLNTRLADIIRSLGYEISAERIGARGRSPDFRIRYPKLGLILGEAEIGRKFDDHNAIVKLEERSKERFEDPIFEGFNHIMLVTYPKHLREVADEDLEAELKNSNLGIGIASRMEYREPCIKYNPHPVKPAQIPQVFEQLAKEIPIKLVEAERVSEAITQIIMDSPTFVKANGEWEDLWLGMADTLEIEPSVFDRTQECVKQIVKTSFTLCATSVIVYELARDHFPSDLEPIDPVTVSNLRESLEKLEEKNYEEAIERTKIILARIPEDPGVNEVLGAIFRKVTVNIEAFRSLGWEILSSLYQQFLSKTYRKAYATFYTKMPSAHLLARLSVDDETKDVIDPACGSGSLLLASQLARQWLALESDKIYKKTSELREPITNYIGRRIMKEIVGLDALRAALSITGSVLTIASNAVPREPLKLFPTPCGMDSSGSLELLLGGTVFREAREATSGKFDLNIMNPPFTRSDRISNLIGNQARERILKSQLAFGGQELSGILTAGLAKPFMALADKLVRPGGRIASVLPTSMLGRPAWRDLRKGMVDSYCLEYIVISWAPETPNFSSDVRIREILCVMRKEVEKSKNPLKIINLSKSIDRLSVGEIDHLANQAKKRNSSIFINGEKIARISTIDQKNIRKHEDNLYRLVSFYDPRLLNLHLEILKKSIKLEKVFEIGSVIDHTSGLKITVRELLDPKSQDWYYGLWGSGRNLGVKSLQDSPRHIVSIKNRSDVVVKFWNNLDHPEYFYRSNDFILKRGRLSKQFLLMPHVSERAVSNVWWPLSSKKEIPESFIKMLRLYLNSTIGFIHMLGERLETEGLYVDYKKNHLLEMKIPDFSKILEELGEIMKLSKILSLSDMKINMNLEDHIRRMKEIEEKEGDYEKLLDKEIERKIDDRVKVDKASLEMIKRLGIDLKDIIGPRFYSTVCDEIERLASIRGSSTSSESVDDVGNLEPKPIFQTVIDDF